MRQRIVGVFLVILTTASTSFAEQARPTQQQMQSFLMQAVGPLRSCLARSLPAPPRPHVVVTLEFDPAGGFPMPMEIEAAPGSAIERCVGEALAELNAPAMPGPALRIQCRFPISGGNGVQCRPAPADEPPPPPPPNPSNGGGSSAAPPPPPSQPQAPLSREEVAEAMRELAPNVRQCAAAANPPPTLRLRIQIDGQGQVSLLESLPVPPASVSTCLAGAVSRVRLRATGREPLSVLFPFTTR